MQTLDPVLRQNESGKTAYTPQKTIPLSMPGLHPFHEGDDGENGISFQDTPFEPVDEKHHEVAANIDHVRSFSQLEPGDTVVLLQLLLQPDLPPPGAVDRQSRSSRKSDFEPEETKRTRKARTAARCRYDSKTSLRLKDDLRERNRIAAAKHRIKKRKAIDTLEENARNAGKANEILGQEVRSLRNQLTHWRNLALQHVHGEGGCRCAAIRMYNAERACQLILGAESAAIELPHSSTLQASIS
jgi:hypothetical protein